MKRLTILVFVLLMATILLSAEVVVLPAGTSMTFTSGPIQVLEEFHFLLTRDDMETAALAMETVDIQKEALERYEKALAKSNGELLLAKRLLIVLPLAGAIAGAILDLAIRTNFFTR